jgi:hypothetical protein
MDILNSIKLPLYISFVTQQEAGTKEEDPAGKERAPYRIARPSH